MIDILFFHDCHIITHDLVYVRIQIMILLLIVLLTGCGCCCGGDKGARIDSGKMLVRDDEDIGMDVKYNTNARFDVSCM